MLLILETQSYGWSLSAIMFMGGIGSAGMWLKELELIEDMGLLLFVWSVHCKVTFCGVSEAVTVDVKTLKYYKLPTKEKMAVGWGTHSHLAVQSNSCFPTLLRWT